MTLLHALIDRLILGEARIRGRRPIDTERRTREIYLPIFLAIDAHFIAIIFCRVGISR
jgi:hypothetical protein